MVIDYLVSSFKNNQDLGTCICLGKFDGVHIGHQKLLNQVLTISKSKNLLSLALCIYPNPSQFFSPKKDFIYLDNLETRQKKITQIGINYIDIIHFNNKLANLTAEDFVNYLLNYYNLKVWVVGSNIRFGKGGSGNLEWLMEQSKSKNFEVIVCDYIKNENGEIFSSSSLK
jgi:riboflavin kinase / FMN adenylyltransferase